MLINQQMWRTAEALCGRWTAVNQIIRTNSDMAEFREIFSKARHIAIITGAGVSAESGVPSIRGAEGRWRTWKTQDLATPECFSRHTSRVWEFYHYRRELSLKAEPSAAHRAIAECEARLSRQGRSLVVITQNIDELHQRAGSRHVLEVHDHLILTHLTRSYLSKTCPGVMSRAVTGCCGRMSSGLERLWTLRSSLKWRRSWRRVTSVWWWARPPSFTRQPCLVHRWRPAAFQWLNSTLRPQQTHRASGLISRAAVQRLFLQLCPDTSLKSSDPLQLNLNENRFIPLLLKHDL